MIARATAPHSTGHRSATRDGFWLRERIRGPTNPSIAGRNVSAEIIVKSTPMLAATAIPYRKLMPSANIPRSATQTIGPANSTARPHRAPRAGRPPRRGPPPHNPRRAPHAAPPAPPRRDDPEAGAADRRLVRPL